ncbi:MAG: ATP-binding protein [Pirellulales bacterium]
MSLLRSAGTPEHPLLAFVADLELELNVLRKQLQYSQHSVLNTVNQIQSLCEAADTISGPEALVQISSLASELQKMLLDLQASHDSEVVTDSVDVIELRPFIEQVFRWQQRLCNAPYTALRFDLGEETIHWFPARLRHILENLISNSLRYRDTAKGETRLSLTLRTQGDSYEFRLTDNGVGMSGVEAAEAERGEGSSPSRSASLGVGLSVVTLLVAQAGGTVRVESSLHHGTSVVVMLPRYELGDYLSS